MATLMVGFCLALGLVQLLSGGPRRLGAVHHVGGIFLGKVGHEFAVDDFLGADVARAGDERNQDADGEPAAECQAPTRDILAIRTHPKNTRSAESTMVV